MSIRLGTYPGDHLGDYSISENATTRFLMGGRRERRPLHPRGRSHDHNRDYITVMQGRLNLVPQLWAAFQVQNPSLPNLDTLNLQSEPITIVLQADAYRKLLLRVDINDTCKAPLLAYATGADDVDVHPTVWRADVQCDRVRVDDRGVGRER